MHKVVEVIAQLPAIIFTPIIFLLQFFTVMPWTFFSVLVSAV